MADKLLGLSQTLSAQLWVGRLAMAGFLTSCVEEIITGKGTLQQIGLFTPNPALFGFLLVFFGGLTAYATARTIYRATNKEMTAKCVPPLSEAVPSLASCSCHCIRVLFETAFCL